MNREMYFGLRKHGYLAKDAFLLAKYADTLGADYVYRSLGSTYSRPREILSIRQKNRLRKREAKALREHERTYGY